MNVFQLISNLHLKNDVNFVFKLNITWSNKDSPSYDILIQQQFSDTFNLFDIRYCTETFSANI